MESLRLANLGKFLLSQWLSRLTTRTKALVGGNKRMSNGCDNTYIYTKQLNTKILHLSFFNISIGIICNELVLSSCNHGVFCAHKMNKSYFTTYALVSSC